MRFDGDEKVHTITVGASSRNGSRQDPVLAVFEADGAYYICRGAPGGFGAKMERVERRTVAMVQEFTPSA